MSLIARQYNVAITAPAVPRLSAIQQAFTVPSALDPELPKANAPRRGVIRPRGSGRHFVLFLFSRFPPTRPRGSSGPPSLPPSVERGIKNVRARVTLSRRPAAATESERSSSSSAHTTPCAVYIYICVHSVGGFFLFFILTPFCANAKCEGIPGTLSPLARQHPPLSSSSSSSSPPPSPRSMCARASARSGENAIPSAAYMYIPARTHTCPHEYTYATRIFYIRRALYTMHDGGGVSVVVAAVEVVAATVAMVAMGWQR
ncbi:hypothetical protein QTP88_013448 [Uroleucon formosanum]